MLKLPGAVREVVMSEQQSDVFHEIMQRHGLTVAEIAAVAEVVAPIVFGLILPKELPGELRRSLPTMPAQKISTLVDDINDTLLAPIRAHLLELAHQRKQMMASPGVLATRTLGGDIATAKLSGNVHLPPDTMKVKESAPVMMPSAQQRPPSPVQGRTYAAGADPYREPSN